MLLPDIFALLLMGLELREKYLDRRAEIFSGVLSSVIRECPPLARQPTLVLGDHKNGKP
jgi:hypothetical protein